MSFEKFNRILAQNILYYLGHRGMKKQDLARVSGLSNSFISDVTNQNANPSLQSVIQIASGLDVSLAALFIPLTDWCEVPSFDGERPNLVHVVARVTKEDAQKIRKMHEKVEKQDDVLYMLKMLDKAKDKDTIQKIRNILKSALDQEKDPSLPK
ncbi:MAG: helix-turn-helix domain-containing protein [Desulfobacteraceae bacterium]